MTPEQFKQEILAILPDFSGEVTTRDTICLAFVAPGILVWSSAPDEYAITIGAILTATGVELTPGDATFYHAGETLADCLNAYVAIQMEGRLATIRKIRELEASLESPAIPEELASLVPKWRYAPVIEQFRTKLGTPDAEYWDTESAITSVRFCARVGALRYTFDAVSEEWWCETLDGRQSWRGESPEAAKQKLLRSLGVCALSHAGERARAEETLKRVEREEALIAALRAPQGATK